MGISKNPGQIASGIVLILVGLAQATHSVTIDLKWTLVVAGALFIMEALNW